MGSEADARGKSHQPSRSPPAPPGSLVRPRGDRQKKRDANRSSAERRRIVRPGENGGSTSDRSLGHRQVSSWRMLSSGLYRQARELQRSGSISREISMSKLQTGGVSKTCARPLLSWESSIHLANAACRDACKPGTFTETIGTRMESSASRLRTAGRGRRAGK